MPRAGGTGLTAEQKLRRVYRVAGLFSEGLMFARAHSWRSPRLKQSALSLLRSAAEEAGLVAALDEAALEEQLEEQKNGRPKKGARRGGSLPLVAAALRQVVDGRLVDPLLTLSIAAVHRQAQIAA